MNEQQAEEEILKRVQVSRQDIIIAKSFILAHFNPSPVEMVEQFTQHLQIQKPEKVVLHESVPAEPQLTQVVNVIRWQLAFAEAIWSLVGAGLLLPVRGDLIAIEAQQAWTTVIPGSGGHSSGWRFGDHNIAVPSTLRMAPSIQGKLPQPLSDPDLFLSDLEINDIHPEIEDVLRQAVECFRRELYLPCVAMLGMASEGAWIELGLSLAKVASTSSVISKDTLDKIVEELNSPYASVLQKLETVAKLYERKDIFNEVIKQSGYNRRQLAQVLNWSNVVRDARNAIHYGAGTASENTYEKVATLLLGVPLNLRILYSIRRVAETLT